MEIQKNKGTLSDLAIKAGILDKSQLLFYVRSVPYGRTAKRDDFSLVFSENKGTCSTKHALIKAIAVEQEWSQVELLLVMYKMNRHNTPPIGNVLYESKLDYLPEAHCVLKIDDNELDITNAHSDFEKLRSDVLLVKTILPMQVGKWKVAYHQEYLRKWIIEQKMTLKFDEIWTLREKCIHRLSEKGN